MTSAIGGRQGAVGSEDGRGTATLWLDGPPLPGVERRRFVREERRRDIAPFPGRERRRPRLTPQERCRIVDHASRSGVPLTVYALRCGIQAATLSSWIKAEHEKIRPAFSDASLGGRILRPPAIDHGEASADPRVKKDPISISDPKVPSDDEVGKSLLYRLSSLVLEGGIRKAVETGPVAVENEEYRAPAPSVLPTGGPEGRFCVRLPTESESDPKVPSDDEVGKSLSYRLSSLVLEGGIRKAVETGPVAVENEEYRAPAPSVLPTGGPEGRFCVRLPTESESDPKVPSDDEVGKSLSYRLSSLVLEGGIRKAVETGPVAVENEEYRAPAPSVLPTGGPEGRFRVRLPQEHEDIPDKPMRS
ncbi:MAG: hypothetical protein OXF02_06735 [Simkaniaceae bacterium]|nr:hypothetical protein [Simkaniaceae bacterium]